MSLSVNLAKIFLLSVTDEVQLFLSSTSNRFILFLLMTSRGSLLYVWFRWIYSEATS